MTTTNSATIETGDNSEAIAIRLKTADGIERLAHVPLAWLIEAVQNTAPDREFAYPQSRVAFRIDDDGALVMSDDDGATAVMPAERRPQVLADLKRKLPATWVPQAVFRDSIDESLADFTARVAEWNRLVPADLQDATTVETEMENDDDGDPVAVINVTYLRPPTADEQAQRVATDRQHEKWERETLARLLAKYGSPDAAEPSA
jgi:hypothetical protein